MTTTTTATRESLARAIANGPFTPTAPTQAGRDVLAAVKAEARIAVLDASPFTPNSYGFRTPYFSYRVTYRLHNNEDLSDRPRHGSRCICARSTDDAHDMMIARRALENGVTSRMFKTTGRRRSYIGQIHSLIERA